VSKHGTKVLDDPADPVTGDVPGDASVVVIHPPDAELGRRAELSGSFYRLGRDATCEIRITRESVSRFHAELRRDLDRGWRVVDLESTNGTYVNEREVHEAWLRDGDLIRFGDVVFKFLAGTSIEHQYHDELYQLSVLDGLTGVHNRRHFVDFLDRELASAKRHQHPLTLVMFDIDDFKRINDARGHVAGDLVLREVADRIRPRIRREDLFARYGGEEFAAILTVTTAEGGVLFAEALRRMIGRQPFAIDGQDVVVTMSSGVACTHGEPEIGGAELIGRADDALYEAKRQGKDRVVVAPAPAPLPD
jgi:diguanylate cyclase (GGDEF)-like protein